MVPWVAWVVFLAVAAVLGVTGSNFSVRTLRWVTAVIAVGLFAAITAYGLSRTPGPGTPPTGPGDVQTAFVKGTDAIVASLFYPLRMGREVPELGRVGWVIIIVLILIGYRQLEARAYSRQPPLLDISQLGDGQPGLPAGGGAAHGSMDRQRYDQLAAELKFRLVAMEVRSPPIMPGGSRTDLVAAVAEGSGVAGAAARFDGLAAVAEGSGVSGGGLAGAVIRLLGPLWPGPRRWQLRFWVETPGAHSGREKDGSIRVTVELDNPQAGVTVASRTIAAASVDEAASKLAGYVARQVFARDPATPPWCYGDPAGSDLGALLIARQAHVYADSPRAIADLQRGQIEILSAVAGNRCAGFVRYELAQLLDLNGSHLASLHLHAQNREQHPRFLRARYRLAMSLEMVANPGLPFSDRAAFSDLLTEILAVLHRCGLTISAACPDDGIIAPGDALGGYRMTGALSLELLEAARAELRIIRRQLTLPAVLWASLLHRDERAVWRPYRRLRGRQAFRDGTCVAELLVAARLRLNEEGNSRPARRAYYRHALRVAAAITGDNDPIESLLWGRAARKPTRGERAPGKLRPAARDRVRLLPWQRQTASWLAAYNTGCIYAVLAQHGLPVEDQVVMSLQRASSSRDAEIGRPFDWIARDPDFVSLRDPERGEYLLFMKFLRDLMHRDYLPRSAGGRPDG